MIEHVCVLLEKEKIGRQATTHQDAGDFTLSPRKGSVKRQLSRTHEQPHYLH